MVDTTICTYTGKRYLNENLVKVGIKVACSPSKVKPEIVAKWVGTVIFAEGNRLSIKWDIDCEREKVSHYDLSWAVRTEQPPFVVL